MKFLMAVSAIDIAEKPLATRFWWSLFRALSDMGHELTVVPFLGKSIESQWWQPLENPSRRLSSLIYSQGKNLSRSSRVRAYYAAHYEKAISVPRLIISRNWRINIEKFLKERGRVDVIVFFSVPINLLSDIPSQLNEKWDIPSVYYEGDMPEILPSFGGIHFSYYVDANLSQFRGFLSNSSGVRETLTAMGAENVETLHWAVDPRDYTPTEDRKDTDVFFSGGSSRFRHEWMRRMIAEPARQLPMTRFAVSGRPEQKFENVRKLGFLEFADWKRQICKSSICLNISRTPHAATGGTSTTRVFELASLGACVVSNPHKGMDDWFQPRKEIMVLGEDDHPQEVYDWLLGSPGLMHELGSRARDRVLAQHTYEHRAAELMNYLHEVL